MLKLVLLAKFLCTAIQICIDAVSVGKQPIPTWYEGRVMLLASAKLYTDRLLMKI